MALSNTVKCRQYRESRTPLQRAELKTKQREGMRRLRRERWRCCTYQNRGRERESGPPRSRTDVQTREAQSIFQVLRDLSWAGHMGIMRRKAMELSFRIGLKGVKALAKRAREKARQPSKLFAWFLQNLEKVCEQGWCRWQVQLRPLPMGMGETVWGKQSTGGMLDNILAMAKGAIHDPDPQVGLGQDRHYSGSLIGWVGVRVAEHGTQHHVQSF